MYTNDIKSIKDLRNKLVPADFISDTTDQKTIDQFTMFEYDHKVLGVNNFTKVIHRG